MIHEFLRSIGFSELKTNADLQKVLQEVTRLAEERQTASDTNGNEYLFLTKNFGNEYGVTICGTYLDNDEFKMEYYFPLFRGSYISTYSQIELESHSGSLSYAGICDEMKLGVTLIFYVANIVDIMQEKRIYGKNPIAASAMLSGLALNGKVLLPVMKTENQKKKNEKSSMERINMIQKAREGNQFAIDNLTLSDMDTYSMLSRRVYKEDVLSIVESSFIPYGIESDQYIILGEIINCYSRVNYMSMEPIWVLAIKCNEIKIEVCINCKDLMGEPEIGRRFKGRVWLQGYINFS